MGDPSKSHLEKKQPGRRKKLDKFAFKSCCVCSALASCAAQVRAGARFRRSKETLEGTNGLRLHAAPSPHLDSH